MTFQEHSSGIVWVSLSCFYTCISFYFIRRSQVQICLIMASDQQLFRILCKKWLDLVWYFFVKYRLNALSFDDVISI